LIHDEVIIDVVDGVEHRSASGNADQAGMPGGSADCQ
jgi:hypothetical protein